jgi:hypothetical protein
MRYGMGLVSLIDLKNAFSPARMGKERNSVACEAVWRMARRSAEAWMAERMEKVGLDK